MANSTPKRCRQKPKKPHADFPLFPHATGRWAKKVRGKLEYFGPWDDPQAALEKWLAQKDDLLAGRRPRLTGDELTVRDLVNRFLTSKQRKMDAGEMTPRSFQDYYRTCKTVVEAFGKNRSVVDLAADDFEELRADLAKRCGPHTLGNEVQRVRSLFKYAYDDGLIDRPVRFGQSFKKPSRRVIRQHRYANGKRMFDAQQIRTMLETTESAQLRAMILLGINCGFGNQDCGTLPCHAVDLDGGWHNYPRPKTAVPRRCPLWPETVDAIRAALAERHAHKGDADADLVFITKYGKSWAKDVADSPITKETRKLLDQIGIKGNGINFYCLRRTFETVGGETADQVAVNAIMGHVDESMAAVYRQGISDERLIAVTDHVRNWLFGEGGE